MIRLLSRWKRVTSTFFLRGDGNHFRFELVIFIWGNLNLCWENYEVRISVGAYKYFHSIKYGGWGYYAAEECKPSGHPFCWLAVDRIGSCYGGSWLKTKGKKGGGSGGRDGGSNMTEYRIVYRTRVMYEWTRLSLGLASIILNVRRTWKLSVQNENNVVLIENSVERKPCINR